MKKEVKKEAVKDEAKKAEKSLTQNKGKTEVEKAAMVKTPKDTGLELHQTTGTPQPAMTATGHPQPTGGIAKPKTKQLAKEEPTKESKPAEGTTVQVANVQKR